LSDIDNDGQFEFFHDVLTDIPGARGPDPQHQNNGIAFDDSGNLFLAVGTNDDRTLDDHPWGGTILKASPDFQRVEIFAKGFRNPFGLAIGPRGSLFVSDNDVRSNAGDEVNHVRQGLHYGHPWIVGQPGGTSGEHNGFENPIYVAPPNDNLCGVAYAGSAAFPASCRGCLFVVNRPDDSVLLLRLAPTGERLSVSQTIRFAKVLSPVEICCTERGEIFVLSRVYRKLYRIRATGPA
jgi:glucose/arabinose dehydrogenase